MESRELNSALIGQELHDGWVIEMPCPPVEPDQVIQSEPDILRSVEENHEDRFVTSSRMH